MWTSRTIAALACAVAVAPMSVGASSPGRATVEGALASEAEGEYIAGRFKQAAILFHRAFEQRQDVGYLYSAGRAEQQAGLIDEALATYATVLRLAPKASEFARKAKLHLDAIKAKRAAVPVPPGAPPGAAPSAAPAVDLPPSPTPVAAPAPATPVAAAPVPVAPVAAVPVAAAAATTLAIDDDVPRTGWWWLAGGAALAVGGAGLAWSSWSDVRKADAAVTAASPADKPLAAADYKAAAQASRGPIIGGWVAAGLGAAAAAFGGWSLRRGASGLGVTLAPGPANGLAVGVHF
ncbi:MAG: hypothetical protein FJ100_21665 [Deltaproteobacteria bacterium]|nr:hypothetical protein [Deltaproteobacteria bacterium]